MTVTVPVCPMLCGDDHMSPLIAHRICMAVGAAIVAICSSIMYLVLYDASDDGKLRFNLRSFAAACVAPGSVRGFHQKLARLSL